MSKKYNFHWPKMNIEHKNQHSFNLKHLNNLWHKIIICTIQLRLATIKSVRDCCLKKWFEGKKICEWIEAKTDPTAKIQIDNMSILITNSLIGLEGYLIYFSVLSENIQIQPRQTLRTYEFKFNRDKHYVHTKLWTSQIDMCFIYRLQLVVPI